MAWTPLPTPQSHWTPGQRLEMRSFIQEHVSKYPEKRDINIIVSEILRQIPALWNDETQQGPEYYSYSDFTREYEIIPHMIPNQISSKYYDTYETPGGTYVKYPKWAVDDFALQRMFSILGFWFGPMDPDHIAICMPGILQGGRDGEWVRERIMGIQRTLQMQHTKIIFEVIKPITMHFLMKSNWILFNEMRVPVNPFENQNDRMRYFETFLESWMVPYWLYRSAPHMINIRWLYQKTEPQDPGLRRLRQDLCQVLKERFLQLVDATYIFLIDQAQGTKIPVFDQRQNELLAYMLYMNERFHPRLGVERTIILHLPVWGPDIPQDVRFLWTDGLVHSEDGSGNPGV